MYDNSHLVSSIENAWYYVAKCFSFCSYRVSQKNKNKTKLQ